MILSTAKIKPHLKVLGSANANLIRLDTRRGTLTAEAQNFTVRITDQGLLSDDGQVCLLPASKFGSFVSKARENITLAATENGTRLLSGSLSVEFPRIADIRTKEIAPKYHTALPTGTLKELVNYASAVTNPKESMTYSGVMRIVAESDLFDDEGDAGTVRVLASDGHRAAKMEVSAAVEPLDLLLPATLVAAIQSFDTETGTVDIADETNYVALRCGAVEAIATKYAISFPSVHLVFQPRYAFRATADADELKRVVSNIQPFLDETEPDVLCSLNQKLVVSTGTARDEASYSAPAIPDKTFRTPFKFLADFLSRVTGTLVLETDKFDRIQLSSGTRKYMFVTK